MSARGKGHSAPTKTTGPPAPEGQGSPRSPLDDPDVLWYVRPPAGGQYGPASSEVMRSWIDENRITPSTLLWRQGWSQWRSAREALPGLLLPVPPADATAAQPAAAATATTAEDAPGSEPIILFGQSGIGQVRNARSQRRLTLIILLAVISIVLVGLLLFIALREKPI
jgi:hypothetical protein